LPKRDGCSALGAVVFGWACWTARSTSREEPVGLMNASDGVIRHVHGLASRHSCCSTVPPVLCPGLGSPAVLIWRLYCSRRPKPSQQIKAMVASAFSAHARFYIAHNVNVRNGVCEGAEALRKSCAAATPPANHMPTFSGLHMRPKLKAPSK
jgi:hypothetical protein